MIFDVPDPDFEQRIRRSFSRQGFNDVSARSLDA